MKRNTMSSSSALSEGLREARVCLTASLIFCDAMRREAQIVKRVALMS